MSHLSKVWLRKGQNLLSSFSLEKVCVLFPRRRPAGSMACTSFGPDKPYEEGRGSVAMILKRRQKNKNMKEWKDYKGGTSGWWHERSLSFFISHCLSLGVFYKHIHICLFVQIESLWGEEKQSSNSSNEITVRSEPRSYHSLCFKNTVSPQSPQATLYIWQQTMWNPKSKEQGSQCVPDWIKED